MARRLLLLGAVSALALVSCEELPNVPPTASFIYSPVSPIYAGQTAVVFNASASRDSDGQITNYVWNFGDGTPEENVSRSTTSHVFPDTPARCIEVIYTVLLTVVDDKGDSSSANQTGKVIELPAPTSAECQPR
jgi:PKD repeat protein